MGAGVRMDPETCLPSALGGKAGCLGPLREAGFPEEARFPRFC